MRRSNLWSAANTVGDTPAIEFLKIRELSTESTLFEPIYAGEHLTCAPPADRQPVDIGSNTEEPTG